MAREVRWEIRLCGRVAATSSDGQARPALPGRQGQLLLAYLVCHRTRACPRYELEDVAVAEGGARRRPTPRSARCSPSCAARSAPSALTGRAELRLALPEPLLVDIEALGRGGRARRPGARGPRATTDAAAQARAALAFGAEPFLAECDGPWVRERRREVEGLRLRALEALGEAGLRSGGRELDAAEQAARAAIGLAPFRESAHRLLMEVHEAAGNPAEALRAFEELRSLLREELGTTPGPAAMAVHERLLRGDGRRAQAPRRPRPPPPGAAARPALAAADRDARVRRARATSSPRSRRAGTRRSATSARLVLLAGDAGIGKSRLAAEFTRARAPRRRGRALRPLRRGPGPAPTSRSLEMLRGWSGGARAGPCRRSGSARAPPSSPSCCRSSARRRRPRRSPRPRRTRSASASSTRSPRCSARSAPARRWCSCSTTCTGPTGPTLQLLRHLVRAPQPRRALFLGTYREARSPTATRCTS